MNLSKGISYTNETSDLAIKITNIYYESDTYYKVRAIIYVKKDGRIQEIKGYKLQKDLLKSWIIYANITA